MYMKDINDYTDRVFLYTLKVADLEEQLKQCEDGLHHYQNLVSFSNYC